MDEFTKPIAVTDDDHAVFINAYAHGHPRFVNRASHLMLERKFPSHTHRTLEKNCIPHSAKFRPSWCSAGTPKFAAGVLGVTAGQRETYIWRWLQVLDSSLLLGHFSLCIGTNQSRSSELASGWGCDSKRQLFLQRSPWLGHPVRDVTQAQLNYWGLKRLWRAQVHYYTEE